MFDTLVGSTVAALVRGVFGVFDGWVALDGLMVLAVGLALAATQLTDHGIVLNEAVRGLLDALPAPLRVHERFVAQHWAMVSNLWKYALILVAGVVLSGIDLSVLNLAAVDPVRALAGGLAFGCAVYAVGELVALAVVGAFGYEYDTELRSAMAPESSQDWLGFVGISLVVVSCWEELLFRAVFVGVAAYAFGVSPWLTGAVAVVAFGLIHNYAPGNVLVTGFMGAVLTVAFVLGASLPLLIVAHTVANALEFAIYETALGDPLPRERFGFGA